VRAFLFPAISAKPRTDSTTFDSFAGFGVVLHEQFQTPQKGNTSWHA
jgi:hypothetical protein